MASPVSLQSSALPISSYSFVERSGNLKALLRPRLPRVRTALAGPLPLPQPWPYLQLLRRERGTANLGPEERAPAHVLTSPLPLPIGLASFLIAPETREGNLPIPVTDGETEAQDQQVSEAETRRTPPILAQLPIPRPRPASRRHKKTPQKPGRPGRGGAAQSCPSLCAQASGCWSEWGPRRPPRRSEAPRRLRARPPPSRRSC